jgi:superfamily II DNA or RNA helicase
MKIKLRDYQLAPTLRAMERLPLRKTLVQMPTGGGKTHIAAWIAECAITRLSKNVWFLAHRQELIDHAARVCDEASIPRGSQSENGISFATVAGIGRLAGLPAPDMLIFDECHHVPATSWGAVIEAYPRAQVLGLTATPHRLDGKPLADYFEELVCGPSTRQLIESGKLSRYRYFAPALPDLKNVAVNRNEYDRAAITEIMTCATVVGDAVEHYQRHASGRTAILFAVSVKASIDLVARFAAAGISAAHLDADTPEDEREALLAKLATGEIKVLSNVELLTEGIDIPTVGAVILMRPTKSLTLFRQMVGRGLRYVEGAPPLVILDHAGLYADHGAPDADYVWTLDGKPPRRKMETEGETHRSRRCTQCNAVHEWADSCPECGHEYGPHERATTEIGGKLVEVSVRPGVVTFTEYARMKQVSWACVRAWQRRGMPTDGFTFVDIAVADAWLLNYNRRSKNKNGLLTQLSYAKLRGRSQVSVNCWVKRGLPVNEEGLIDPSAADDWVKANTRIASPQRDGYLTIMEYSKIRGYSPTSVRRWVKKGLPIEDNGLLKVINVDEWIKKNVSDSPISSSGLLTRVEYARHQDTCSSQVSTWVRRGLPISDAGLIDTISADDWVLNNHKWRAKPEGDLVSLPEYCRLRCISYKNAHKWKTYHGFPISGAGLVAISAADEWLKLNQKGPFAPKAMVAS